MGGQVFFTEARLCLYVYRTWAHTCCCPHSSLHHLAGAIPFGKRPPCTYEVFGRKGCQWQGFFVQRVNWRPDNVEKSGKGRNQQGDTNPVLSALRRRGEQRMYLYQSILFKKRAVIY